MTRMVLTNAIYFKGLWAEAFAKKDTRDAPFHTPAGNVSVPTMHRFASMRYGQADKVRFVELPYKDSELAMLVVLPAEGESLAELVQGLTSAELAKWSASLRERKVQLALPKLEFSWGRSVKPELMALGIRKAFGLQAEFGGMVASGNQDLKIDDVFHKTFVLVDEVGTEAAAATGVVMVLKSAANLPVEMKVDRPFLFFIRNTKTGDVLFAGRVENPKEAG